MYAQGIFWCEVEIMWCYLSTSRNTWHSISEDQNNMYIHLLEPIFIGGYPRGWVLSNEGVVFKGVGSASAGHPVWQSSLLHQTDGQNMQSSVYWTIERCLLMIDYSTLRSVHKLFRAFYWWESSLDGKGSPTYLGTACISAVQNASLKLVPSSP